MAPAAASSAPETNMASNFDEIPGGSFVEEAAELKQLIHQIESSAGNADISVFKKAQEIVRRTSIGTTVTNSILISNHLPTET